MNYPLIKDVISLIAEFESEHEPNRHPNDVEGFKQWIHDRSKPAAEDTRDTVQVTWEGKEKGRTPESAIATRLLQLSRYARTYSKSAIHGSAFSTQDEFIYLINLNIAGEMTKMELIRKNIHDKPAGMLIINRLLRRGWIEQSDSPDDRRSKKIRMTPLGMLTLESQMQRIRKATNMVAGNLQLHEKTVLIGLLNKLGDYHHDVFSSDPSISELLDMPAN